MHLGARMLAVNKQASWGLSLYANLDDGHADNKSAVGTDGGNSLPLISGDYHICSSSFSCRRNAFHKTYNETATCRPCPVRRRSVGVALEARTRRETCV